MPIPVAVRSSTATSPGIAGSNPAEDKDVCLFLRVVCFHVEVSDSGWLLTQRVPTEWLLHHEGKKLLENDKYDIILYNSEQIYILGGAQWAGCI